MTNVSALRTDNNAETIRDLERLVADLRSGKLSARGAVVVVNDNTTQMIEVRIAGDCGRTSEVLGMLAFAQHEIYDRFSGPI